MSYTSKVIYTRPSAEVSLFTPSAEFTTLIDTYFNAGKITQKPVLVEDGLTSTYTTVFKDLDSFNEFKTEQVHKDNYATRATHCANNSISYSLESE